MVRGSVVSGTLASLFNSDDNRLVMRPGIVFSTSEAPLQMQVDATAQSTTASTFRFKVESAANQGNIRQTISLFNFNTNSYEQLDTRIATTNDTVVEIVVTTNASRFVNPATGAVRSLIAWKAAGPVFSYPWLVSVDQVRWQITP